MKAKTRMFGEIDIQEDKIITLESGMIGFPDMQKFTLIFDEEKGSKSHIMWLQSMDDPQTAFPVINPVTIKEDYNPSVSEELLKPLGDMKQEDTFVLTTVRVPKDIQDMSINLKAPIIINMSNNRGAQKSVFLLQRMYQFTEKKYTYRFSRKMRLPSVQMVWMR